MKYIQAKVTSREQIEYAYCFSGSIELLSKPISSTPEGLERFLLEAREAGVLPHRFLFDLINDTGNYRHIEKKVRHILDIYGGREVQITRGYN